MLGITQKDQDNEDNKFELIKSQIERLFGLPSTPYQTLNEGQSLERLKLICKIYNMWIKKEDKRDDTSFYDGISNGFNGKYSFDSIMKDFRFIIKNQQLLINDKEINAFAADNTGYLADDSFILNRSARDKNYNKDRRDELAQLFFIKSKGKGNIMDDEDIITNICIQEMMDTIYCYIYHTIRLNPKEIEEKQSKYDEKNKSGKDNEEVFDRYTDTICSMIELREKSGRFRRNGTRYKSSGNKFMSSNIDTDKQKGGVSDMCFMDALRLELKEAMDADAKLNKSSGGVNMDRLHEFNDIIEDEDFDSEGIENDFQDAESVIINELKSKLIVGSELSRFSGSQNDIDLIDEICGKFVLRVGLNKETYSFGWRYFYWPHYQNIQSEYHNLWKTRSGYATESNPGYMINEWYIAAKYNKLKEESLNNKCCPFCIYEYNISHKKASIKLSEWNKSDNVRKLLCNKSHWHKFYGIREKAPVLLEHVIALLQYTNFTDHSFLFSKTYRRSHPFESDRSVKARHSEVAIWGKRLRELIECFGDLTKNYKDVKEIYHGINSSMIFKSTSAKMCGPLSCTTGMYIFMFCTCYMFVRYIMYTYFVYALYIICFF